MPESLSEQPNRAAIVSVLPDDLREELERVEEHFRKELEEALVAKGRATDLIRTVPNRPSEYLEHEIEVEYTAMIDYHAGELTKKIRWLLKAWKDTLED